MTLTAEQRAGLERIRRRERVRCATLSIRFRGESADQRALREGELREDTAALAVLDEMLGGNAT